METRIITCAGFLFWKGVEIIYKLLLNRNGDPVSETIEEVEMFTQNKGWLYLDWENIALQFAKIALMIIIGILIIKLVRKLVQVFFKRHGWRKSVLTFVDSALKFILTFLLVIIVAHELGLETTSLIALLGSLGIAIGLALQGSLSDLASGILIIVLRPIRYQDLIFLGDSSDLLKVKDIRLFNTAFENIRGFTIILPNKSIVQNKITNLSKKDLVKIQVDFSVSYDADIKRVREIINDILKDEKRIAENTNIQVSVTELADSGINMFARGFVKPEDYLATTLDVREKIKLALDDDDIEIPYPQMEVRLYEEPKCH